MSVQLAELTGTYTLDKDHTRLGFVARHAMVTKVRGAFQEFDGTIEIDGDEPEKSSARVVIQAKSITTGNDQRDGHLRSNDFLALDEYPEITFVSTGIEKVGDVEYKLNGDLTVRGVTRPVTLDVEYTGQSEFQDKVRLGFEARTVLNRKDFGVNWNLALETGGFLVSDKVTLELDIEAVRVSG
jgi:polyisoprenoid-binding protein YceI